MRSDTMKYIVGIWVPELYVEVDAKDEGEAYDIARGMLHNGDPGIEKAYDSVKGQEEVAHCYVEDENGVLEEICEY